MAENSAIEWTDHTMNPWIGCTKVSPGCDYCYAEARMDTRLHRVQWGAGQPRQRTKTWDDPVRWNKQHDAFFAQHGRRQRVFCASLADVFDNEVPDAWRDELIGLIVDTPNLDWLLLTKRIGNVSKMLKAEAWRHLPHVWLGATVVDQAEADRDIPKLLAVPARVRFLSIEPMLGPIDLQRSRLVACANGGTCYPADGRRWVVDSSEGGLHVECICSRLNGLHWIIAGGESGPGARPMHPDWPRALRDQCAAAGVQFLFKQWGEWGPAEAIADSDDRRLAERWLRPDGTEQAGDVDFFGGDALVYRAGKAAAGRLLDGVEHNGFPAASLGGSTEHG